MRHCHGGANAILSFELGQEISLICGLDDRVRPRDVEGLEECGVEQGGEGVAEMVAEEVGSEWLGEGLW